MDEQVIDPAQLSDALLAIEDQIIWEATGMLRAAIEIEQQATALGDELLVFRARLCQTNMRMRQGDIAGPAGSIVRIHEWAVAHDARTLQARTQLIWANIHRHLGDGASCLEHSVRSVELLDETATSHMQVWHRAKLADALGFAGSMDAARARYAQSEQLAVDLDQPRLLMAMLNNYAYTEFHHENHVRAQQVAKRIQEVADAHGFELDPGVLDTIGSIEIENGRYADAERTMQKCIEGHAEGQHDDADALAEYQLTLARAQRALGATDRAQATLDASRALCVERELGEVLVRVHLEQSELHAARGEFSEAFAMHKVFVAAYNSLHNSPREAQARTSQSLFETAEARQEAERFREQARRDPLTGLRNRRYVDEHLPGLIRTNASLTAAIVDLDHFKRVNDQLSHDVGDQVLVLVAKLLETELAAVSPEGFVARMGGEEFLVVMPETELVMAVGHLDDIRRTIRSYAWREITAGLPITVSIGVAGTREAPDPTQPELLGAADRHLYVAKRAGRDRVVSGLLLGRAPDFAGSDELTIAAPAR